MWEKNLNIKSKSHQIKSFFLRITQLSTASIIKDFILRKKAKYRKQTVLGSFVVNQFDISHQCEQFKIKIKSKSQSHESFTYQCLYYLLHASRSDLVIKLYIHEDIYFSRTDPCCWTCCNCIVHIFQISDLSFCHPWGFLEFLIKCTSRVIICFDLIKNLL